MVAFEIDWGADPPEVQQTKWTFAGRLLDRKDFRLTLPGGRCVARLDIGLGQPCTFGNKTMKRLGKMKGRMIRLTSATNYAIDKLNLRW